MGYCDYHNEEKSGPWNGWYCNKEGRYVDSSLYGNYCNSSVSCKYCPIRGGDDRYRKKPEPKPEPQRNTYSSYDDNSYTKPTPTGSYSSGGGGCLDRLFFGFITVVFGGFVLFLAAVLILSKLGFFREDVLLNLTVPSDVNPRHFTMEVISHDPNEDYQVDSAKVGKDGSAKIRMEVGMNSVYLIYDDEKISLSESPLNGETAAAFDLDYAQVQEQLCQMVIVNLKDQEGAPVPVGTLAILDDGGTSMQWMPVGASQIVLVLPEGWTGRTVTLTVEGYAPLEIALEGKDRLYGADVHLKPTE